MARRTQSCCIATTFVSLRLAHDAERDRLRDPTADWSRRARTWPTAPGGPSARTTRPTATPGRTSRSTTLHRRVFRWGEDGLAGFSDGDQRLCLGLALWNGQDPVLKERLFGLANEEGNHGEDVKEEYFYLDATPTHSYLRMLYRYPQAEFPYQRLRDENRRAAGPAGIDPVGASVLRLTDTFNQLVLSSSKPRRLLRAALLGTVTRVPRGRRLLAERLSGIGIAYPRERGDDWMVGRRMPDIVCGGKRVYELLREGKFAQ